MEEKLREGKLQVINTARQEIEKRFGKGSLMRLGEHVRIFNIKIIPTGILSLDLALGVGGFPGGRVIEIFGPEATGKTTLALQAIAEAQKTGGFAAFVDAEHSLDPRWAQMLGVNIDELLLAQPDNGEQALEIVETLARSGALEVIVVDSVAALVPRAEIEGEMGDAHMGLQARLMSQALRKLTGALSKSNTCCIFVNQLREKIGVTFGNPETTSGGRALKFYASLRLDVRRLENLKEGDEITGCRLRVRVVKNKVAPPFKEAEFDLLYQQGISREGCLLDLGLDYGILEKSGNWYSLEDIRLGQGRENARDYLKEHPEIGNRIENRLKELVIGMSNPIKENSGVGEEIGIPKEVASLVEPIAG